MFCGGRIGEYFFLNLKNADYIQPHFPKPNTEIQTCPQFWKPEFFITHVVPVPDLAFLVTKPGLDEYESNYSIYFSHSSELFIHFLAEIAIWWMCLI